MERKKGREKEIGERDRREKEREKERERKKEWKRKG